MPSLRKFLFQTTGNTYTSFSSCKKPEHPNTFLNKILTKLIVFYFCVHVIIKM